MSEPTIRPTRAAQVGLAAAVGGVGAWLAFAWWQGGGGTLPVPGVVAWAAIVLISCGVAFLAWRTRKARAAGPAVLDSQQALRRLLLGKTSQLAGAFLGGAYAAIVILALPGLPAPLAAKRVIHGGIAVVANMVWVIFGRMLENSCRIPPQLPESDTDTPAH